MSSGLPNPTYGISGLGLDQYGNEPIESLPIGYYQNILTSQYRLSPKWTALLYALLRKFQDVTDCINQLDFSYDLDYAEGVQLDVLGAIVQAPRTVPFQPSGGVSPVLDDDSYRVLIKATIAGNQWDGTIDSLYLVWHQLFPGGNIVIEDNQNMSADIVMTGVFSSIMQDMITNGLIVPRPEGVLYNYLFTTLPAFGFGSSPGYIAGFQTGHWAD